MTSDEYNQRLHGTISRLLRESPRIKGSFGKCGSAEVYIYEPAVSLLIDWASGKHRGKPPWITGRHKTRGGRDQDRWRKMYPVVKDRRALKRRCKTVANYCRANNIPFLRFDAAGFAAIDGVWKPSECCYPPPGWIKLEVNDDCDFVKDNKQ